MPKQKNSYSLDWLLVLGVAAAVSGLLQFMVRLPLAVTTYAGGSRDVPAASGYSLSKNWLSDLGRQVAWNGKDNLEAAGIFNSSVTLLGVGLLILFLLSIRAAEFTSLASVITGVCGAVSSLGLLGIAATPFDRQHDLHIVALLLWIVPMLVVAASFSYQAIRAGGLIAIVVPASSLLLFIGMVAYAAGRSTSQVMTLQKLAVLISVVWLLIIVARVSLAAVYVWSNALLRSEIANRQAGQYMKRLQAGHLQPFERRED